MDGARLYVDVVEINPPLIVALNLPAVLLARAVGASEILVTSSRRWVLMHELRGSHEPPFDEQVKRISPCDLLLVEGFKFAPIPKLEVWRAETGEALLHPNDPHIVAVASDAPVQTKLPRLDLNDDAAIAAFMLSHLQMGHE